MIKIKGHEIAEPKINASFGRKATQIEGFIIATLKRLGITRDSIDIPMEKFATRNVPAKVSWYFQGRNFKYTYAQMPRFVENLYIINKVLELEIEKFLSNEMTMDEFIREFSEDDDLGDQLAEARKNLEVDADEKDLDVINKSFKKLARKHHPDMSGGNHERFQEINASHKLILKELA